MEVEPDDVGDLGDQIRVGGELERVGLPRLDPVLLPRRGDGRMVDPSRGASNRDDQCVTPRLFDGGVNVAAMIFAWSTVRGRPDRF